MSKNDDQGPMVQAYLEIALGFLQIYQFEKTILEASKALRLDSSCYQAYEMIRKAVRKEDTLNVLVAQARQHEKRGDFARAYEEWGQILEFFPLHEEVQDWREKAREKAGLPSSSEISSEEEPSEERESTAKEIGEEEAGNTDTRDLTELLSETRRFKLDQEALKNGKMALEDEAEKALEEEHLEERDLEERDLEERDLEEREAWEAFSEEKKEMAHPLLEEGEEASGDPETLQQESSLDPVEERAEKEVSQLNPLAEGEEKIPSSERQPSPSSRERRDPFAKKIREATALLSEAKFPEAEQMAQEILESHPSHGGALEILKQSKETQFLLNSLLDRIKEHERVGALRMVLQDWEKVLEILPGNKKVLKKIESLKSKKDQHLESIVEKARELWEEKRLRQVLLECQKVLKITPRHPYCLSLLEKTKEAMREAEALLRNARICQEAGEWQKAKELAEMALDLDPKKAEAREILEDSRQHLKKTKKMDPREIGEIEGENLEDISREENLESPPIKTPPLLFLSEIEEDLPETPLEKNPEEPSQRALPGPQKEEEGIEEDDGTIADLFVSALKKAKKQKPTTRRKVISLPEESGLDPLEKELTSFLQEKETLLNQQPQKPSGAKDDMDLDWKKPSSSQTASSNEEFSDWRQSPTTPTERKDPPSHFRKNSQEPPKEQDGDSIIDWD